MYTMITRAETKVATSRVRVSFSAMNRFVAICNALPRVRTKRESGGLSALSDRPEGAERCEVGVPRTHPALQHQWLSNPECRK